MQNVVVGWIWRRFLEIGGVVGFFGGIAFKYWSSLDPAQQSVIARLFSRAYADVTIGELKVVLIPFAMALWGYVWSFRSTVAPQVVTSDGKRTESKKMAPEQQVQVEIAAKEVAVQPKSIFDGIFDWLRK